MATSYVRQVLECGGKRSDTAFSRQNACDAETLERSKAPSPLRAAGALHDASAEFVGTLPPPPGLQWASTLAFSNEGTSHVTIETELKTPHHVATSLLHETA